MLSSGRCAYKLGITLLEPDFWSTIKTWSLVAGFGSANIQHSSQLEVKLSIFLWSWVTADSKQAQWMQWISTNFRFWFWDKEPMQPSSLGRSDTFRLCLFNLFYYLFLGRIRAEQLWSRCLQLWISFWLWFKVCKCKLSFKKKYYWSKVLP